MTSKCPSCGASHGPSSFGSNSANTTTIEVPTHLLFALNSALQIGSTTALMCGASEAQDALSALRDEVRAHVPEVATHFDKYAWFSLCQRAADGRRLEVRLADNGRYYSKVFWIEIIDGEDEPWPGSRRETLLRSAEFSDETAASSALRALRDEICKLAPMPG
jgi:hypothetical protein